MDCDFDFVDSIFGFDEVLKEEWELYVNNYGLFVVKQSKDGNIDLMLFWKVKVSILFVFYKLVLCYLIIIIGSYEEERLFLVYNEIFDKERRFLDESIIRVFYFLNWNFRIRLFFEEEREK